MRIISAICHTSDSSLSVAEHEAPTPGSGEVLITTAAAGVNRADILQRRGLYPSPPGWPTWPGLECAGIVSAVGDAVTEFSSGDSVCALVGGGAYAEQVVAPAELVLPVPDGLTLVEAAGLMEAACTVWSNLDAARAMPGETVLIHGGSGGIGTLAIQLAAAMGLRVITTARGPERARRCLELGAHVAVDYTADDFVTVCRDEGGADIILDVIGAAYLDRNLEALAIGGRLVIIGLQKGALAQVDLGTLLAKRTRIIGTTLRSRPHQERAAIVAAVARDVWPLIPHHVRPIIHSTFSFDDAQSAHDALDSGEVFGKLVLVP